MKNLEAARYSYQESRQISEFLASRFADKRSLNVVFNLKSNFMRSVRPDLRETVAPDLACFFKNKLNQRLFGSRYKRFGVEVPMTIAVHKKPHMHLHCHIAIEDDLSLLKIRSFCDTFSIVHPAVDAFPYAAEARNNQATERYNARFGAESLIIF